MKVFMTGASGWIGSATAAALIAAGHEVTGLARSAPSAEKLAAAGIAPHEGSLEDLDSLRAGAAAADAVVHLGFKHDFSDMAGAGHTERSVIEAFGDTLAGTGRALLLASGVAGLTPGRVATEADRNPNEGPASLRGGGENLALSLADRGVRPIAMRFAPSVHGAGGDHGFVAYLAEIARRTGVAGYIGDGSNAWPAVAREDAAALAVLALESAPAGSVVHAVGEEGVATREIARALGDAIGVPAASIEPDAAAEHFGWMAHFFGLDTPASNALTRERFGWTPTGATLLEDIAAGHYPGR